MDITEKIIIKTNEIYNSEAFKKEYKRYKRKKKIFLLIYIIISIYLIVNTSIEEFAIAEALIAIAILFSSWKLFFPPKPYFLAIYNKYNDFEIIYKTSLVNLEKIDPYVIIEFENKLLTITHISGITIYQGNANLNIIDKSTKSQKLEYNGITREYTTKTINDEEKYYVFELENDNFITFLNLDEQNFKKIQDLDNSRI